MRVAMSGTGSALLFVDFSLMLKPYGVTKVDKGVVLGVAQTLGTEYFPAACDCRLNLHSCFAEQ